MKVKFTLPQLVEKNQTTKTKFPTRKIRKLLQAAAVSLVLSQATQAQSGCTPPTGNLGSGQNVCSGFSPSVYTGELSSTQNCRYRIAASLVSGNVTGFTTVQTGVNANEDVEPNVLTTISSGIVRYTATPYAFGPNGVDNGGIGDDCISTANSLWVDVVVTTCQPSCIGTRTFSTYRNTSPVAGITSASFMSNDGSNQVLVTSNNSASYNTGFPSWIVDAAGIRITKSGGISTTKYSFNSPSSDFTFSLAGLETAGAITSPDYIEQLKITGKDVYGLPVAPQFYNLQEGAQVINGNEIKDGDGGLQASASFYFNEPVKEVFIEQVGTKDDVFVTLNGCSFPADFGDLTTGIWPIASATVPGVLTNNVPDAYNAVTRPGVVVWAGNKVSTEPFTVNGGDNAAAADMDDDGITPPMMPIVPGTVSNFLLSLNANAQNTKVYYRMWFDWNNNGSFADDMAGNGQRATYGGSGMVNGGLTTIPVGVNAPFGAVQNYKVRLAVSNDTIADVYDNSPAFILNLNNGEIEDYQTLVILPVKLLQFSATKQGSGALLNWKVAEETNLDRYDVEYSSNGIAFSKIGFVSANGSSSYSFVHTAISRSGSGYYRLKSVDKDGRINYSPVRSLNWDGNITISVTPNPVKDRMQIRMDYFNDNQKMSIRVSDATGRVMANKNINNAVTDIDVSSWANGMYQVQISNNNQILSSQKVIKN